MVFFCWGGKVDKWNGEVFKGSFNSVGFMFYFLGWVVGLWIFFLLFFVIFIRYILNILILYLFVGLGSIGLGGIFFLLFVSYNVLGKLSSGSFLFKNRDIIMYIFRVIF